MADQDPITTPHMAGGRYAPYGPPPWYFEGYSAAVVMTFDPAAVQDLIPPPLKLIDSPVCRLTIHDMMCDYGLGERFPQDHPDQAHFGEAVIGFMVECDGVIGHWAPYLWCTTDAELAVGRELYGWQQRLGEMDLTRPPLRRSWKSGDRVTGLVTRGRRAVFDLSVTLDRNEDLPAEIDGLAVSLDPASTNHHYTETVLAHPTTQAITRRLVSSSMDDVQVTSLWSGAGTFAVHAPELTFLKGSRVLGGRWHELSWRKPWPNRLIGETSETHAAP
jgi:acetoacetate decarboxylase